jgi:hypothetical protein
MGRVIFASEGRCSAHLYAAGIEPGAAHAGTKKQDDACVMAEGISETRSPTLTQGKHEKRGAKSCICSRGSDICSADISPPRAQASFCWRIRPSEGQRRRGACTSQTPLLLYLLNGRASPTDRARRAALPWASCQTRDRIRHRPRSQDGRRLGLHPASSCPVPSSVPSSCYRLASPCYFAPRYVSAAYCAICFRSPDCAE